MRSDRQISGAAIVSLALLGIWSSASPGQAPSAAPAVVREYAIAFGQFLAPDEGDDRPPKQKNLLIIGASSLMSPLGQHELVGALLNSNKTPMNVEPGFFGSKDLERRWNSGKVWDYVIMDAWQFKRGATAAPGFPDAVVAFVKKVRDHSPQCKIILFPWWIPSGPDATNEGVMKVFQRCVEAARQNDIWVATTGPAFMEARLARRDLHVTVSEQDAHPGIHGAYINACSLYAILTGESPVGLPATLKIPGRDKDFTIAPDDAKYLQELAWKVYQRELKHTKPANDWSQFRGRDRCGVSEETGLTLEWSATKNILWKTPLPGPGSSSPIVFGKHVYVTCYSGYGVDPKTPGNMADLKRHLICVDRDTGKILWSDAVQAGADSDPEYAQRKNIALHGYASHTPAADESGVYAYFGSAGAVGYNHAGERKWGPLALGSKAKIHIYGSAASPLLYQNLLIVNAFTETADEYAQGDTVALDKRTGEIVWREKVGGEWTSPLLVEIGGKPELVVATFRGRWLGLDPATGQRLWACQGTVSCGTPIAYDGVVYAVAENSRTAFQAGGRGDVTSTRRLWQESGGPRISSAVYHDGYLYWSNDGHTAFCADARTGKSVYRERLGAGGDCYASPVVAEGRIYYVSRLNGAYVVAARPTFELLAHNRIEDDNSVFNGSPAVSNGQLFLRSDKWLYCIGVK